MRIRPSGSSPRIRGESPAKAGAYRPKGIIPANTGRIPSHSNPCTLTADHPREYGENFSSKSSINSCTGSSPRIRGEFIVHDGDSPYIGIIPANTGRMQQSLNTAVTNPDHPREYGENKQRWVSCQTIPGSSPRIRGESPPTPSPSFLTGIIPANTGRMATRGLRIRLKRDHPREYGENSSVNTTLTPREGSSPRIRGE